MLLKRLLRRLEEHVNIMLYDLLPCINKVYLPTYSSQNYDLPYYTYSEFDLDEVNEDECRDQFSYLT